MPKLYTRYVCQSCGKVSSQAFGRCPGCGAWDSMVEEVVEAEANSAKQTNPVRGLSAYSKPRPINQIESEREERIRLDMEEFARVLGGGIVPGSIVLIGGDPGIGKSTLTLQMSMQMAKNSRVLYVSGEESEHQIKMRANRLALNGANSKLGLPEELYLVTETNLSTVFDHIGALKPKLVIIDSIQTMTLPEMESSAGSIEGA